MVILFLFTFRGKFKKLYKAYYTSSSWKCFTFSSFFKRWFFVTFPFFEALSPLSDSVLGRSSGIHGRPGPVLTGFAPPNTTLNITLRCDIFLVTRRGTFIGACRFESDSSNGCIRFYFGIERFSYWVLLTLDLRRM